MDGMSDAAPGVLIPYMQTYYGLHYGTVSFMFLAIAAGFIAISFFGDAIYSQAGRAKTIVLGCIFMGGSYLLLAFGPPFGAVILAFFFIGAGMGLVCCPNP